MARRRLLVRELSGGRAGYLHIPDMMGEGGPISTATCESK